MQTHNIKWRIEFLLDVHIRSWFSQQKKTISHWLERISIENAIESIFNLKCVLFCLFIKCFHHFGDCMLIRAINGRKWRRKEIKMICCSLKKRNVNNRRRRRRKKHFKDSILFALVVLKRKEYAHSLYFFSFPLNFKSFTDLVQNFHFGY